MNARRTIAKFARAQRLETIAQRRVLVAFVALRAAINQAALGRAVLAGNVITVLPLEILTQRFRTELLRLMRNAYEDTGDEAARKLKAKLVRKDITFETRVNEFQFNVVNDRGLRFLQQRAATQITGIIEETRDAMRQLLSTMYASGVPVTQQVDRIQEQVGLTSGQSAAVENLRETLTDQGVAPVRIDVLTARKADELLRLRALTIARTELATALAAGRRESWEQAADQGLFTKTEAERVWSTAEDEATCPTCEPMDGQRVPYDGLFTTGDGDQIDDAPAHVNCRCGVDLVL